jgi:carbon storage regulator
LGLDIFNRHQRKNKKENLSMLVLTRKVGQSIVLTGEISIVVLAIEGERVKIGVNAPPEVSILREELTRTARPDAPEGGFMDSQYKLTETMRETVTTADHYGVLNAGGLLLIEKEELEEEMDPDDLATYDHTLLLSPGEALHLATVVERHRSFLQAQERELDTSLRKVAEAWLEMFAPQAERLCMQGNYWWPQVRYEAQQTLMQLIAEETHPLITAWYEQALRNRQVRREQQEILLTRIFKRLYDERYPVPTESDTQDESALDAETIREIGVIDWADQPVIAIFGGDRWMVGMNGIAAMNYEELEAEARALVEPLRNRLLMRDLGLEDEEDEKEVEVGAKAGANASMSGHHYFTCPEALAARARFVCVGMRVRGRDANGEQVTGEVIAGHWRTVTLRDEEGKEHPGVEVRTLEVLSE